MHDLPAPIRTVPLRPPARATLATAAPSIDELFDFMTEAELRFETLRLRIVDERTTTEGQTSELHDVWLRHPGQAKVVTTRGDATDRDFEVWIGDGERVRTYDARMNSSAIRPQPARPAGSTDKRLPRFARLYVPVTPLPPESVVDTFIHPNGFTRNVLATGVLTLRGTAEVNGREQILLRCDHPRTNHVLTDRPDHWLEVAVDRQIGLILVLAEHVGDRMTRHARVTSMAVDEPIGGEAFQLHVSDDTRSLY
ncbi:MAG TPA: hypothetical protein VNW68_07460 [Candidatus Limnocylindria bacterium]|nr:hypothetical protein [Candidatus Limnocylindria bacterium]